MASDVDVARAGLIASAGATAAGMVGIAVLPGLATVVGTRAKAAPGAAGDIDVWQAARFHAGKDIPAELGPPAERISDRFLYTAGRELDVDEEFKKLEATVDRRQVYRDLLVGTDDLAMHGTSRLDRWAGRSVKVGGALLGVALVGAVVSIASVSPQDRLDHARGQK